STSICSSSTEMVRSALRASARRVVIIVGLAREQGLGDNELCVYCVAAVLTGDEKLEHPIPAALGSSMTVSTVCNPCNEWAGREIDQPFLADDLLKEYRSIVDQRDPRCGRNSRRSPSPLLRGHTPDGD